jgi:hypothetical protein
LLFKEKGLMKHVDKNNVEKKKKAKPRSTIGALGTKSKGRSMTQYFSVSVFFFKYKKITLFVTLQESVNFFTFFF